MPRTKSGIRVMDLFCGGGGFSEGFHMAGFDVAYGADFWKPACDTHAFNGLGRTDKIDLLHYGVDEVLALKSQLEREFGQIDVLIGSPPCTEFSYAKKGGKGDVEKGMLLVRKHLLFVSLFRPRYWLMENVPRLEEVLAKECEGSIETGWRISYDKLGIPQSRAKELGLKGDYLSIPKGKVHLASDYGTCENRKRFIVGDYPLGAMDALKVDKDYDISLGGLLDRFQESLDASKRSGKIEDPNYPGHFIRTVDLRDNAYDTSVHPMYLEEMRHLKRRHIQYGRMDLPDDLSYSARTIMATYNSSSRESILLETGKQMMYQGRKRPIFRQPTVRVVASIQGFPLDFQLVAQRIGDRYKLIGNAVPCQLSYAIARAIREDIRASMDRCNNKDFETRATVTLRRADSSDGPIIGRPASIVEEADDINRRAGMRFRAKPNKQFRRKVLSSKLENDSCIIVFENSEMVDGRVTGGVRWRACFQMGVGSQFYRIYLDRVSVARLISQTRAPLDSSELMECISAIIRESDKGIPKLKEEWIEFPGYNGDMKSYTRLTTRTRLKVPTVTQFQDAFTSDKKSLDGIVGPLDFFDGMDAIMLRTFVNQGFHDCVARKIAIASLNDADRYSNRTDPRILPRLSNTSVPFVTIAAGLLSVHVLSMMYRDDPEQKESEEAESLMKADGVLLGWVGS